MANADIRPRSAPATDVSASKPVQKQRSGEQNERELPLIFTRCGVDGASHTTVDSEICEEKNLNRDASCPFYLHGVERRVQKIQIARRLR